MSGRWLLAVLAVPAVLAGVVLGAGAAAGAAPMVLPGGGGPQPRSWIVGARPSGATQALALLHRARARGTTGALVVPRGRAVALARALRRRGLLRWAEPDLPRRSAIAAVGADALPWRDRLGVAALVPPAAGAGAPFLALLDTPIDLTHPAFGAGNVTAAAPAAPYDLHGTATAAVAAGTGLVNGVWPGSHVVGYPFPERAMTCSQSALLLERASADGAAVVNMSYGSEEPCFTERAALQLAVRRDVLLVAAAGNERRDGDPMVFPAGFPHVVTVAALGHVDRAATFSSSSRAIDVAAPGRDILTAVPLGADLDGVPDGLATVSGTSFAAPMVAAAAVWLRAARPALSAGQVAALLCASAREVGVRGWDRRTGCGALDLGAALGHRAPRPDPGEPNDDVLWVDGTLLPPAAPLVWRGTSPVTLGGSVTASEDPVDVYRVRLPACPRVRIALAAPAGEADLRVLDRSALGIGDRGAVLARLHAPAAVTVANATRAATVAFVAIMRRAGAPGRSTGYRLRIRRACG